MNDTYDVFISYRRSDGKELAEQVKMYLEKRNIHAYLDTENMIDGMYFDTQLRTRLVQAPAYVLIATPDVFRFRPETDKEKDWVLEEIRTALSEHAKAPEERRGIPFVMHGTEIPDSLPAGLEDFPRENRIDLKGRLATGDELLRLSKAICFVNTRNLWETGRSTLQQSTAEGGRFHLLHIDERIMPLYKKGRRDKPAADQKTLPIHVNTAEGEIPLFVELNRAPVVFDLWYKGVEGMESTFIRREICRQLLHHTNLKYVPDDYLHNLMEEFTRKTDKPQYLLLLDGLNEVSSNEVHDTKRHLGGYVRSLIIEEINHLLTDCPNVRVMLTSRTDETEVNCTAHGIEKLYLTGLKDDIIADYLHDKKCLAKAQVLM